MQNNTAGVVDDLARRIYPLEQGNLRARYRRCLRRTEDAHLATETSDHASRRTKRQKQDRDEQEIAVDPASLANSNVWATSGPGRFRCDSRYTA